MPDSALLQSPIRWSRSFAEKKIGTARVLANPDSSCYRHEGGIRLAMFPSGQVDQCRSNRRNSGTMNVQSAATVKVLVVREFSAFCLLLAPRTRQDVYGTQGNCLSQLLKKQCDLVIYDRERTA
jgi:hypothetical protein